MWDTGLAGEETRGLLGGRILDGQGIGAGEHM